MQLTSRHVKTLNNTRTRTLIMAGHWI